MNNNEKMVAWLKKHDACKDGFEWAVKECGSLEDVWNKARPEWLIWVATREGTLTDRELHEFGLWSAGKALQVMEDVRSLDAARAAAGAAQAKWLRENTTPSFN